MRRLLLALTLGLVLLVVPATSLAAQSPYCAPGEVPTFTHGFAALASLIPTRMGDPIECAHSAESGIVEQRTTTGLAVYDAAQNLPSFITNYRNGRAQAWALYPSGLVYVLHDQTDGALPKIPAFSDEECARVPQDETATDPLHTYCILVEAESTLAPEGPTWGEHALIGCSWVEGEHRWYHCSYDHGGHLALLSDSPPWTLLGVLLPDDAFWGYTEEGRSYFDVPTQVASPLTVPQSPLQVEPVSVVEPPIVTGGLIPLEALDGAAFLIAEDGTFLGVLSSNQYDRDSVCNRYGNYGSRYANDSVRNPYSNYGSPYASQSAYNPYTSTPPLIIYNHAVVGHLSKNRYVAGAVDPDLLFAIYDCVEQ